MPFPNRVLKTYGRLQEKTVRQDNWISPHLLAGRKMSHVFSSPENDSLSNLDQGLDTSSSGKENILPVNTNVEKKVTRKAARRAKSALQEHAVIVDSDDDALVTKETNIRQKKNGKAHQFTKLSHKYTRLQEKETSSHDEKIADRKQAEERELSDENKRTASKISDLLFDHVYDLTKEKNASGKSSSENDCMESPDHYWEEEFKMGVTVETSTPCEVLPADSDQSLEVRGHITRRRKRENLFSPDRRAHRRLKRHCVVSSHNNSFIEDRGVVMLHGSLRTRNPDFNLSDIACRLLVMDMSDDQHNNKMLNLTQECTVLVSKDSESSVEDVGNGSTDLFVDNDAEGESLISGDVVKLRPCKISLTDLSRNSHQNSEADTHSMLPEKELLLPVENPSRCEKKVLSTPVTNRSIDMNALDSFKVALTPVRSRNTGSLLPPRRKVLAQCKQQDNISFASCLPPAVMKKCVKIGEGVYGEVFRAPAGKQKSVALKVIPIEGDITVNGEKQKTFEEILPEIVISRELSDLRHGDDSATSNFIEVKRVACVQGSYPKKLLSAWDKYDLEKKSENERPDMFLEDQLFIIFEFADGGIDLESFEFENVYQAVSVAQQVTGALAIAEHKLAFEHRDLHWGNVLIGRTSVGHVTVMLDGEGVEVESHGLIVSIIDFTLSRLKKDECTVFCDVADDPTLFTGQGDKQFDVYRSMRDHNGNKWETFYPKTNVFWLEYLLDKLIWGKKYPSDRRQRLVLGQLKTLVRELRGYHSAQDVFQNSGLMSL